MATTELKYGNDAAAQQEARMIIEEQSKAIIELSDFINSHGMPAKKNWIKIKCYSVVLI